MEYKTHQVDRKNKIRDAVSNGKPVMIRFMYQNLTDGDDLITLTKTQINAIQKAIANSNRVTIKMSQAQLETMLKSREGFLVHCEVWRLNYHLCTNSYLPWCFSTAYITRKLTK